LHHNTVSSGECGFQLRAAPEPSALGLFALGLLGFLAARRRRN